MERWRVSGNIKPGELIERRDAYGDWYPCVARSHPHLNKADCPARTKPWMVVRVELDDGTVVNWPAADVRHRVPRRAEPRGYVRMEVL